MADVYWPIDTLKPQGGKLKVSSATISGGRSLSGLDNVIANDAGFWRLAMANIAIRSHLQVRLWNAFEGLLQGRSGIVNVPILECGRQPWPTVAGRKVTSIDPVPFSDGAFFDDGSGFSQRVIVAALTAGIAARAVSASIDVQYGAALATGMHFGFGVRAYRITRINSIAYDSHGSPIYSVVFWPPAREAIPDRAELNFDRPVFQARLASDAEMDFDPSLGRFGTPTLNFVEDLSPPATSTSTSDVSVTPSVTPSPPPPPPSPPPPPPSPPPGTSFPDNTTGAEIVLF